MSILSNITGIGISRKGIKIDPKKAALTALGVGAGVGGIGLLSKAGWLTKLRGAGQVAGAVKSMGHAGGPGEPMDEQMPGADPSRFRQVGGFLKDNARTIADYGKLGEGIYDRYQQNQDRQMAQDEYRKLQPLRDSAMAGLMDTSRPDLSHLFADPENPQGRYRRVSVGSRGGY